YILLLIMDNNNNNNNEDLAIIVNDVHRGYGNTKVITGMNLCVKRGSINGLIGPSGCGKTTLLKIILGRLIPDSGKVFVFGSQPHTRGHNVPGSDIGYAPQETALYDDLSIGETFNFHQAVHGMSKESFQERKTWLCSFLELPRDSRIVGTLSGGQKRRVSLAVALLHNPKLLILDEPTVGVDPLLRSRIWQHLREIAKVGVTVIVTTHYIEEARMADRVSMMRYGKILAQGVPDRLITKYACDNLEEVFLKLCLSGDQHLDNDPDGGNSEDGVINTPAAAQEDEEAVPDVYQSKVDAAKLYYASDSNIENTPLLSQAGNNGNMTTSVAGLQGTVSFKRRFQQVFAIARRKITQIYRNKVVLFFEVLTPAIQIFLFFIAIGATPKNLSFGIVNKDVGIGPPFNINIGDDIIQQLGKSGVFDFHYFNTTQQALDQIKNGNSWGALYIPENFTMALPQRFENLTNPYWVNQSNVDLYLDFTSYQITLIIEQQISVAFEKDIANSFNISINPVQVQPPIYGKTSTTFLSFLAPGMIALITFAHAIGISSVSFVREKIDGSLDRLFAVGVNVPVCLAGSFCAHILLLLIQTTLLMLITVFGFKISIEGDVALVILMLILLGIVGMNMGLVISSVAVIETEAIQLSLASFFPSLLLSGVMWPVQAIPPWFSWISYALPTTWAAEALRDIMIRGAGMSFRKVWQAYLIVTAWAVFLLIVASFKLKDRESNFSLVRYIKSRFQKNKSTIAS
ncbi:hypothetical protein SAMD00019534_083670, partial [Acytostelium subglobosum LB1]|uniref:hypothetical protein n=1 Tax=Acytostelium subglobosum LB1 TaxID=1410327 RepID=UPI0006451CC1